MEVLAGVIAIVITTSFVAYVGVSARTLLLHNKATNK